MAAYCAVSATMMFMAPCPAALAPTAPAFFAPSMAAVFHHGRRFLHGTILHGLNESLDHLFLFVLGEHR